MSIDQAKVKFQRHLMIACPALDQTLVDTIVAILVEIDQEAYMRGHHDALKQQDAEQGITHARVKAMAEKFRNEVARANASDDKSPYDDDNIKAAFVMLEDCTELHEERGRLGAEVLRLRRELEQAGRAAAETAVDQNVLRTKLNDARIVIAEFEAEIQRLAQQLTEMRAADGQR